MVSLAINFASPNKVLRENNQIFQQTKSTEISLNPSSPSQPKSSPPNPRDTDSYTISFKKPFDFNLHPLFELFTIYIPQVELPINFTFPKTLRTHSTSTSNTHSYYQQTSGARKSSWSDETLCFLNLCDSSDSIITRNILRFQSFYNLQISISFRFHARLTNTIVFLKNFIIPSRLSDSSTNTAWPERTWICIAWMAESARTLSDCICVNEKDFSFWSDESGEIHINEWVTECGGDETRDRK